MRYIKMDKVEPGMILGRNILDSNNKILIHSGVPLTESGITRLKNDNYRGIYISDGLTQSIVVDDLIPEKTKNSVLKEFSDLEKNLNAYGAERRKIEELYGKSINNDGLKSIVVKKEAYIDSLTKCRELALSIVQSVFDNSEVSFDLFDLQGEGEDIIVNGLAVCELCALVGKNMGMSESEVDTLAVSALLHDIGKLVTKITPEFAKNTPPINTNVLLAMTPKKKTAQDLGINMRDVVLGREHAYVSFCLLFADEHLFTPTERNAILLHSQREDSDSKAARMTRIYSKIIGIADEYIDVISGKYGAEFASPKEAREKLMTLYDTKFNGDLVEKFLEFVPPYPKGVEVLLSDGRRGVVKENHEGRYIARPIIITEDGEELDLNDYNNIVIDDYLDIKYSKKTEGRTR